MPVRPAIEVDVGGTLTVDVAEAGVITAATVTIKDEKNAEAVTDASATVSGSRLSYTVASGAVDTIGYWGPARETDTTRTGLGRVDGRTSGYVAVWTYTIGGVARKRRQVFDVVRSVLRPTLTPAALFGRYGLLQGITGRITAQQAIDAAWVDVFEGLEASGVQPNLWIDPAGLEVVHAAFAAWRFASNLSTGSAQTGDAYQAWAADRLAEARMMLTDAARRVDFYDANDDLVPSAGEAHANRARRRLSR